MVNRASVRYPEHVISFWDLISPYYIIRFMLFKHILNRLSTKPTLQKIPSKLYISKSTRQASYSLFYRRVKQTTLYQNNKKFQFLTQKKFTKKTKLQDKIFKVFQLYFYKYYNKYKHPILLNYPNFMEITYLCFIICPFRNLQSTDLIKIFPSFLSNQS
jgi:hypothetical protein